MNLSDIAIEQVAAVPVGGGYFFDDQAAIRAGAAKDGQRYLGPTVTPGFEAIREPAEAVSVLLRLSDGRTVIGDCSSVQYAGVAGREPRLHAAELAGQIERDLGPRLVGLPVGSFRAVNEVVEPWCDQLLDAPRAGAYGVTQALLAAAAEAARHGQMAWVIQKEWQLTEPLEPVPLYAQSGENRRGNVDSMILKRADVLPHGLINTPALVGPDGDDLAAYIGWVVRRIAELGSPGYAPTLHFDVYGQVGAVARGDLDRTTTILRRAEKAAGPHPIRIEHPIDGGSREAQIEAMSGIRKRLAEAGSSLKIVADEWANTRADITAFAEAGAADFIQVKTPDLGSVANTVEAVLTCRVHDIGVVLGGSCAETDVSARATTHIALATGAAQLLAKPGMGVDEPLMVVGNEMRRCVRLDELRRCPAL